MRRTIRSCDWIPHEFGNRRVWSNVPDTMQKLLIITSLPILLLGLIACAENEPAQDRYEASGELIALSGADAGAAGACVSCHGLDGQGDGNLSPRLAGLDPGYFVRQLDYFANGRRRHDQMTWIADHLDWPARQRVADYYGDLPIPVEAVTVAREEDCAVAELYQQGDPDRGIEPCASCHGENGAGVGPGNPALAAQPAAYLEAQLHAWASGERYGDPGDAMLRISQRLTAREMAHLGGYSSALPGASGYPGPRAACPRARRPDPESGA